MCDDDLIIAVEIRDRPRDAKDTVKCPRREVQSLARAGEQSSRVGVQASVRFEPSSGCARVARVVAGVARALPLPGALDAPAHDG